jgi:hypothetical protein
MNYDNKTKADLVEIGMKPNAIEAFLELQKLGCPVRVNPYGEDRGHFWISAEEEGYSEWLDYYDHEMFWGCDVLNSILDKHDLYWEWYNPAYGNVYDA